MLCYNIADVILQQSMPAPSDLLAAFAASLAVALASLCARLVVWVPPRRLQGVLPWLQAGAAGLLLGDALLHMLPEAVAQDGNVSHSANALALGVLGLVGTECLIRNRRVDAAVSVLARMDWIGDALHHLVDGIVIGAAFAVDRALGMVVALAIIGHELPREVGNAAVLVSAGLAPARAFRWSVATTAAVPLGTLGLLLAGHTPMFVGTSLAVAAGITLYLSCSDILPGLWQNLQHRQRFAPVIGVAAGLAFMWLATWFDHAR